jgi:hypothetical protein
MLAENRIYSLIIDLRACRFSLPIPKHLDMSVLAG